MMTELEKLDAGLEFCFADPEVEARKGNAVALCRELNSTPHTDRARQRELIAALFGTAGENATVLPFFQCDNGRNIHVGREFLANYNVTILDVAPVRIGDWCMIGPNTLITTVNHPLSPMGRRARLSQVKSVTIGNDVWIGGGCTILPGVTIGSNVVVAAGAVVTKDVPDNCVVAGVPARKIRDLEDDVSE
ncbi:MAG: sugar O-acetyltransferase [Desulfovibrionaceae bacterium]|nr:sugar O-acetyltransferase [Desulfovibrionaceae bacterium]